LSGIEVILGILLGLFVNETCDVSPWLACKLVQGAARLQYRDPERAAMRAEELTAVINERPGKLFKLATAVAFTVGALVTRLAHFVKRALRLPSQALTLITWARRWSKPTIKVSVNSREIHVTGPGDSRLKEDLRRLLEGGKATPPA
jgi:hypothetical protein